MGRPAMRPEKKKKTVSITLTPEQCLLLRWTAAEIEESPSVLVGRLIEAEARKIAKKKDKPLPNTDVNQLRFVSADGQIGAVQSIRKLCRKE